MKFSRLDEFRELHARLTLPTLFVWGADDPTFPEPQAREMARQFPNVVAFHRVKSSKLLVHEERPQDVARHIEGFLTQLR